MDERGQSPLDLGGQSGARARLGGEIALYPVVDLACQSMIAKRIDYAHRMAGSDNGTCTKTYLWSGNGNLFYITPDGTNYLYTPSNRLREVSQDGNTYAYQYNALGDRLQQTVNSQTTNYTLALARGLTQVLDDGMHTYLYGNMRIAQQSATSTEYFLTDALGSVRQLVDEIGALTLAQAYQPYGETLSRVGSGMTSYGFTGEAIEGNRGTGCWLKFVFCLGYA